MAADNPIAPKLVKGALIEMSERFLGPVPNIIIFQMNPSQVTRSFESWDAEDAGEGEGEAAERSAATAQPGDPTETINLSLILDATDALEMPDSHPIQVVSGVADRLSALELLMFPQEDSLLGALLTAAVSAFGGSVSFSVAEARRGSVPITLFVWGINRIVPVRVTSFEVDEQEFSPILYPHRVKVSLGLRVLKPAELEDHPSEIAREIAKISYTFTKKQREVWGAANLANTVESILGMLPS
ncbi:hypothetical protein [Nitratireductor sp. XY-223]|uniref:hypothetical protein n=1 Tax=Nitratireductor sp. XY-223 TaxID=2561926 RepID=UPI0010AA3C42|nr:hypothetical protein [Nitratireductor sp. XY-223]